MVLAYCYQILIDVWHHCEIRTQVLGKRKFDELEEVQKFAGVDHGDVKKNVQFIQMRFEEI
jgi:hypothetical protein